MPAWRSKPPRSSPDRRGRSCSAVPFCSEAYILPCSDERLPAVAFGMRRQGYGSSWRERVRGADDGTPAKHCHRQPCDLTGDRITLYGEPLRGADHRRVADARGRAETGGKSIKSWIRPWSTASVKPSHARTARTPSWGEPIPYHNPGTGESNLGMGGSTEPPGVPGGSGSSRESSSVRGCDPDPAHPSPDRNRLPAELAGRDRGASCWPRRQLRWADRALPAPP